MKTIGTFQNSRETHSFQSYKEVKLSLTSRFIRVIKISLSFFYASMPSRAPLKTIQEKHICLMRNVKLELFCIFRARINLIKK